MTELRTLPYGSWPSPITIDMVVASGRGLAETRFDGDDLYFLESRPQEGGRVVLMRRTPDGAIADVTPAGFNVRTRVHEYGGGAWTVSGGLVVFSNFDDGVLYRQRVEGGAPEAIIGGTNLRFADLRIDEPRGRVLAILEDHSRDDNEPDNSLVAVSLADGSITPLVQGHDFFSHARLSPAGDRLCWLTWDRPNMPWDGSELWVGRLAQDGSVVSAAQVAGGPTKKSIAGPDWAPDGSLVFCSDRSGWWNLYHWRDASPEPEALAPMDAEFAGPQWVFGLSTMAFLADGRIAAVGRSQGIDRLYLLQRGAAPKPLASLAEDLYWLHVSGDLLAFVGAGPMTPTAVHLLDLGTGEERRVRASSELVVDASHLSVPRLLEFPSSGGRTAFLWYYPPVNPLARAPEGELPPLIVVSHGGPTGNTTNRLDLTVQALTSRGFAVGDVDYGGSTGYGRPFRDRLRGKWGIVDLEDCTNAATWLASEGLADGRRMAITGGSAGGFTTLAALCFRDVFAAGASYFGVGDLEALARDTHKFESRYLDLMVAPYPDRVDVYRERSPVHFVDRIRCPVLVLQGADDKVVPPAQAEDMVAAMRRNGVPYAYLLFEGEGHGFRRAENRKRSQEAELSFYAQVFGFSLADAIEPVEVVGLADWRARRESGRG